MLKTTLELLERSRKMLAMCVADFSADDFFVRPCTTANHTCWMLGHLAFSEQSMMRLIHPAFDAALPAEWQKIFARGTASSDDRTIYPTGAETLAAFTSTRDKVITYAKTLNDADLARELPSPFAKDTMTTVDFMLIMPAMHASLHLGQIQSIRRVLGKPVLY